VADELDDFLDELRSAIEGRVREQLARHQAIDTTMDPRRIVDLQIEQERQKLTKIADKFEQEGNPEAALAVESIAEEWLSYIAKQLKGW
jgi:hypothetical protein